MRRRLELGLRTDKKDDYCNWNFRRARHEAGYFMRELAEKINVGLSTISSYEKLRSLPSSKIAIRLSEILNKNIDELFPKRLREIAREIGKERDKERNNNYSDALDHSISLDDVSEEDFLKLRYKVEENPEIPELNSKLMRVLKTLNYRERKIIMMRYGLNGYDSCSLQEIADKYKLTRERIRAIEAKALVRLRLPTRSRQLEAFLD